MDAKADAPEAKEKRMRAIESIKYAGVEKYAEESIKNFFSPEFFLTKGKEIADVKEMIVKTSEQSLSQIISANSKMCE